MQYTLKEVQTLVDKYFPLEQESVFLEVREGNFEITIYTYDESVEGPLSVRFYRAASLAALERLLQKPV
jgi:hypothetical protein